ncbi:hypothetical protein yc1106_02176 [Curvularia clavata]|uniref:Uncharacterized protein n=1 Tax=Curvularia clavata TaxID=95742 RepID=A0A9Q9DPT7_CURCL|nr:hypothetical protein yc1106_02176 [Curvularia clavata]
MSRGQHPTFWPSCPRHTGTASKHQFVFNDTTSLPCKTSPALEAVRLALPRLMGASPALTEAEGLLILWASIDPKAVDEGALNDWWTNEHLPERLSLPGFQRARRYRALQPQNGQNEYLALYQTSNLRHLASTDYLHALNHPTRRTAQFMPLLAKMSRFACESISARSLSAPSSDEPANVRDMLFMVVYQVATPGLEHDLFRAIGEHIDAARNGISVAITHTQLAKVDEQVTNIGSASKSYDGVRFKSADVNEAEPVVADAFIALYGFRSNTTRGLTANNDIVSKHFSDATRLPGLRIRHTNTYELIASLDRLPVSY